MTHRGTVSDRLVGWTFVGVTVCLSAAMIVRASLGHSEGWWEWPIVAAFAALFLFIGLALLMDDPPRWLLLLVVAYYGLGMAAFGVVALVAPDSVLVTVGRGPRTPGAAQIMGAIFLASGVLSAAAAWLMFGRRPNR